MADRMAVTDRNAAFVLDRFEQLEEINEPKVGAVARDLADEIPPA